MKSLFKTIFAKALLVAICVASIICLVTSTALSIYVNSASTTNLSIEEIKEDVVSRHLDDMAYDIVYCSLNNLKLNENKYLCYEEYSYEIKDINNNIKYAGSISNNIKNTVSEDYSYCKEYYVDASNNMYWNYKPDDIKTAKYHINVNAAQIVKGYSSLNSIELDLVNFAYNNKKLLYPASVSCALIAVLSFITLMWSAGRRNYGNDIYPSIIFVIPFDVIFVGVVVFISICFFAAIKLGPNINGLNAIVFSSIVSLVLFIVLSMEAASRIKRHKFISTLLSYRILEICLKILLFIPREIFKAIKSLINIFRRYSIVKRVLFILLVCIIVEYSILDEPSRYEFFSIKNMLLIPLVIYITVCFKKIKDGVNKISDGDLDYKIDTKHMHGDLKKLADQINNISSGMSKAVDEKVKSERMKTELITNVSHDIKTPLTSIINYTDLISKEKTNKKVKEYSEVLLRQANKLKRLTDDLVEVTKANTGNLEVNLQEVNVTTLLSQISGEYEDKIKDFNLMLVTTLPKEDLTIMADPRRLWRVFDNLMNNICKYSQVNTRVYISCEVNDEYIDIYFKNTSKDSLNISAQELKERFVRGESSRNTEGNGLGLSIAESLVELQGGKFDIKIDGDLFKAIMQFQRKR